MAILEWDELCKMPDGAADARGEQKEALAEVAHSMTVCSKRGQLIRAAKRSRTLRTLDAYEKGNVRDAERTYLRVRVSPSLPSLRLSSIDLYTGAR
jgi:Zn-dependent M32 family carboxypeptidase